MKKTLLIITFIILNSSFFILNAQVGINSDNSNPDASAMLDVKSTDKGFLIPRMTTAQRNAIASPATGLLVFDNTSSSFWFYNGSTWEDLSAETIPDRIADTDNDTKIQVEESTDEDIIRLDIAGSEKLVLKENASGILQMEIKNNGKNIILGNETGTNVSGANGRNTLVGQKTGNALSTGATNTFFGYNAGAQVSTGNSNTFIGSIVGAGNNGSNNVLIGKQAGWQNANGNNNTFVGYSSGSSSTGSNNVFLGTTAGTNSSKSNALFIDNTSTGSPLIYGEFDNDFLEVNGTLKVDGTLQVKNAYSFPTSDGTANQILQTDGSGNVTWGDDFPSTLSYSFPTTDGTANQILKTDGSGNLTWQNNTGVVQTLIEDADNDTKIQVEESTDEDIIRFDIAGSEKLVLKENASGIMQMEINNNENNILLGGGAGTNVSGTNGRNTLVGYFAGNLLSSGATNAFFGNGAGNQVTTGNSNTFIGSLAGGGNNGSTNVFIGKQAGYQNANGNNNTIVGYLAGSGSTGSTNVFLGSRAGSNSTKSNALYIDNSSTGSPLIYGEFDNNFLEVNGTLQVDGTLQVKNAYSFPISDGTANQILQTDGSGNVTWGDDFPSTLNYSFPTSDGTANQILQTDGSGNVTWGDDLPSTLIEDADSDTKIQVEESVDEDIIRFDIKGVEKWVFAGSRIVPVNSGKTIAIGKNAGLNDDLSDNHNVFLGSSSGKLTTSGANNIGVGDGTLAQNVTGGGNIALGRASQTSRQSGTSNISIGTNTLQKNLTGGGNCVIGGGSFRENINGSGNVGIGSGAGQNNNGSNNVFIGNNSGINITGSNLLSIDNTSTLYPLIYGEFDNDLIRINGTLNINNAFSFPIADGTANQILKTDGSGNVTWGNDTDNQTLSFSGNNLVISDGNSVDMSTVAIVNTSPSGSEVGGQNANIDIQGTIETGKLRTFQDVTLGGFNDDSPNTVTINSNLKVGETGSVISSIIKVTVNKNVPNVSSNSSEWVTFTVSGAQTGGVVSISPSSALEGKIIIAQAYVSASNTVRVNFRNVGGSGSNPPAMDYYISVMQ